MAEIRRGADKPYMKNVYDAPNSLEAHMVLNLLEQAGISGRIDGEFLQGAAGELPPGRLVRVMVDEADVDNAMIVIRDWDANQTVVTPRFQQKSSSGLIAFIIGCITGGGVVAWIYNSPVTVDGIDFNADGKLDERYIYKSGQISRVEIDRNLDGKADSVISYDRQGLMHTSVADDDFNGSMETSYSYTRNLPSRMESDLNDNGTIDSISEYVDGVPVTTRIFGEGQGTPVKIQHWDANRLASAEFDTDGDGVIDIVYEYDFYEEIASKRFLE